MKKIELNRQIFPNYHICFKFGLNMLRRTEKNLKMFSNNLRFFRASTLCSFIQTLLNQRNDKFQL